MVLLLIKAEVSFLPLITQIDKISLRHLTKASPILIMAQSGTSLIFPTVVRKVTQYLF